MVEGGGMGRRIAFTGVGAVISVALIGLLFQKLPIAVGDLGPLLAGARWSGLAAVVATTAIHFLLTAAKWRYVTGLTARDTDLGWGYYLYSALIGLLGQVMPMQVAMVAGRSVALKFHGRVPLHRGAGAVVYDQFFDLLVPLSLLPPLLLAVAGVLSPTIAALIAPLFVISVGVAAVGLGHGAARRVALPLVRRVGARRPALVEGIERVTPVLLRRRAVAVLFSLSVLRFSNLVLRAWLVAWTLHLDISGAVALFGNCGVTFTLIFAIAPGALGVVEWGWVGMLHVLGVDVATAAQYAIGSRVLNLGAVVALNGGHLLALGAVWALRGGMARSRDDD